MLLGFVLMGFLEVKNKIIKCLEEGLYIHEARENIDIKNLLQIGQISTEKLIDLIKCTNGSQYQKGKHHKDTSIDIHILKPIKNSQKWYIKFYFLTPDTVFISIHESGV